MLDLDYEAVASEWVRAMRGTRSQPQLSRMLGYRSNVVYSWESGRRFPTAAVALQLLRLNKIDLVQFWSTFFATIPDWNEETDGALMAEFLRELRGESPIGDVAARTGFSRFAVSRWLRFETEPRLPDFFRMIEAMSLRLLDFLALTTEIENLPSAIEQWERIERARNIAFELPWSHAVLRVLELDSYRERLQHDERFVAQKLGVDRSVVAEAISALADTGQIRKVGKHWVPDAVLTVDTRGRSGGQFTLKSWWTDVGAERLTKAENGQFSYNLFTVSEVDFEKIRALHLAYFRSLRAIVAESQPAEKVAVVNLHLFDLGDLNG